MKQILLSRGLVALVDDAGYERVMAAGPWYPTPPRNGRTYAQRGVRKLNGKRTTQKLHMFLTGWPQTDHRNGNGLDNQRRNLRPATRAQNNANARRRTDNTSGFKGVSWNKRYSRWYARIHTDGRYRFLGSFTDPEAAARVYDAAAAELFGEFARPNFPKELSA